MDLLRALADFDREVVQALVCPACGQQAGWWWKATEAETSMTCRGCGTKQLAER